MAIRTGPPMSESSIIVLSTLVKLMIDTIFCKIDLMSISRSTVNLAYLLREEGLHLPNIDFTLEFSLE